MRTLEHFVVSDKETELSLMPSDDNSVLNILWNIGEPTTLTVDMLELDINRNCIVFISEFFMEISSNKGDFRLIQFEKTELSPYVDVSDMAEYLMMFYGIHSLNSLPKITLSQDQLPDFEQVWQQLSGYGSASNQPISDALRRNSLQRLLLLSQQVHVDAEFDIPIDFNEMKTIREFHYLVNNNFRELTRVSQYAEILKISPKKLAALFGRCYNRKASEVIADRRNLYAQRKLKHTRELVKNIAYDLNFSDTQTFSHFFKKHNGSSPEEYRSKNSMLLLREK